MKFSINISNISYFLFIMIFAASCTNKSGIIPQKEMSKIIAEIYIADQYAEYTPEIRAQTDSLALHRPIIEKYGYTISDYYKSTSYYLSKGNTYKKIHLKSKDILLKRQNELDKILASITHYENLKNWWVIDTIKIIDIDKLYKYPYLRAVRWLILQDLPISVQPTDTSELDIIGNPIWWKNNMYREQKTSDFTPYVNYRHYSFDAYSDSLIQKRKSVIPNKNIERELQLLKSRRVLPENK